MLSPQNRTRRPAGWAGGAGGDRAVRRSLGGAFDGGEGGYGEDGEEDGNQFAQGQESFFDSYFGSENSLQGILKYSPDLQEMIWRVQEELENKYFKSRKESIFQEAINWPNIDWRDQIHRGILLGLINITETP